MPPTITIDLNSATPVYRQIVDAIRHSLVEGTLQPGQAVPTVRQLALDLGIHFNTVAQAYRVLSDEGWLNLKRRRGAIVLERKQPPKPDKQQLKQALQKLRELTAQLRSDGVPATQIASHLRKLADGIDGE
jgi:DNA-binding transcriptional regulator YhcF (GntR family)